MRALISVSDKREIEKFASKLAKRGVEIISTGGTSRFLRKHNVKVREISEVTGFPEIMDGRVKTLHPKIFGGILARRTRNFQDSAELKKHAIKAIDWVIVNLYPFEKVAARLLKNGATANGRLRDAATDAVAETELLENIDIGGVSLLRAAAKNYQSVVVVCDPADYAKVMQEYQRSGEISLETRRKLARKAFEKTSHYDDVIANAFRKMLGEKERLDLHYEKIRKLRYGENPHQKASFFRNPLNRDSNVTNAKLLSEGRELSFNNMLDTDSAFELCKEFERPTAVFVKHNNPCGVASAPAIEEAFRLSHRVDPLSAYGAVVALNREVTEQVVDYILVEKLFLEVIIAPKFSKSALKKLHQKQNLRILESGPLKRDMDRRDIRKIAGGILVQTANTYIVSEKDLKIVSKKRPTAAEIRAMLFANKVMKHVMSNAIVLAKSFVAKVVKGRKEKERSGILAMQQGEDVQKVGGKVSESVEVVTGIGAGQMSRVDSVFMACKKAGKNSKGSVMASDAFFPFSDAVEEAAKHGIAAIIQPGGSIRDHEIVSTVDKHKMSMVFSGIRLFRH